MPGRDPLADPTPLIRRVYSFVAFHIGHGAEAEDVTSDVFERAVRYRASYDPRKGTPVTWLLGIARRSIVDARLRGVVHDPEPENHPDSGDLEADTLRRIELSDALARLEERERELLAMRYGAGLSSREIGGLVGLEPGAVDVALHRARTRLRSDVAATPRAPARRAQRPRDAPANG
jgi:RNA polymerase sigma factor (sigma-70 family)